jgi:hypothetical protein
MFRNSPSRRLPHRYVRPILEELEWRYVPSHFGAQLELPLHGILSPVSLSVGTGATSISALTITITMTTTTTTTSSGTQTTSSTSESVSFTPTPVGSNPSSTPASGSSSSAAASQPPESASSPGSAGGAEAGPASSPSAFTGGTSQGSSGGTFAFPSIAPIGFAPGLVIQAVSASESTVLGGSVDGFNFQLLGNLPTLLGTANGLQGTGNASLSTTSPAGTPLVIARPDLFTDRTTGSTTALGLSHPALGDREEMLPEQLLIPPDEDRFEPVPQNIGQTLPDGKLPVNFLRTPPPKADAVNPQILDALPAELPGGYLFSDEDAEMSNDEEQPEQEYSGMSAAVAIISLGAGAYWTIRDRRLRRVSADLPVNVEAM